MKVPLVIERNPAVFAPRTVNVPVPGVNSSVLELLVPLFRLTPVVCFKLVFPFPVQVANPAPVKVICTLEVKPPVTMLKLIVPLLLKFPASESVWAPVAVATGNAVKAPPALMVTEPLAVRDLAVAVS